MFQSDCDTEVILQAYLKWGIESVSRFNGMFAYAIFDRRKGEFYLVRDRVGVKPLFYYDMGGNIAFGSELKALYRYPFFKKTINEKVLGEYFANQYIAGEESIFKNTFKLLPGCILSWKNGAYSVKSYWNMESVLSFQPSFRGTYEEALDEFEILLNDAVRCRLISDVPVGVFLSGGYDSSLVTAVMAGSCGREVDSFTIGFTEDGFDESKYAEEVSRVIGTRHHCEMLTVNEARDYISDIPSFYDEPMADASQIATMLLSKAARKGVTVALGGDGGDELFGGYGKYAKEQKWKNLHIVGKMLAVVDRILPLKNREPFKSDRRYQKLLHLGTADEALNFNFNYSQSILQEYLGYSSLMKKRYTSIRECASDIRLKYMLQDSVTYLPDDIMVKVDRAAMGYSLETRSPLLDYRIVEFALTLPLEYKIRDGNGKAILKDLSYKYVDKCLLERPKQGFGVPVDRWMKDDFNGFTQGLFEPDYIKRQGIFDTDGLLRLVEKSKETDDSLIWRLIWSVFVFQLWWDKWVRA